jgi:LPPG:FO 2-phospho-L-lactate transferase
MIVLLTGGTGGAKLVQGIQVRVQPEELVIVCNTADDFVVHGLHVSPDIDTIVYTLAGRIDPIKGWGLEDDTFVVLEELGRLGADTWFRLGDRDLATHITRTRLLAEGLRLSEVTRKLCAALRVTATVLPMSDDAVNTRIRTPGGELSFQEYFVKSRFEPEVESLWYQGVDGCKPAPGLVESILEAHAVIICPSNPATSIGPILAVPRVRQALRQTSAQVVAVSPMVQGRSFSGPAHKLMHALGVEASVVGLATAYRDFVNVLVIGLEDKASREGIEALGMRPFVTSIRMDSAEDKRQLAGEVLALVGVKSWTM